ncbi:methyl farnesoate epoxidase-like [Hetaerina americana]|uniref:methyl farnesoate epoxidase-like n=1 Tax=Hetaerina americana TaxID=62018 RepID=UPI003A7F3124
MDLGATILVVIVILLLIWMHSQRPKNFPPGPAKWPLIGSLSMFFTGESIQTSLSNISRKYGEVVGLFNFSFPIIIISGLEGIREACFRDDLSGRPENAYQKIKYGKIQGIVHASGEEWKLQRRFTLHHLRGLGFGKSSLDGIAHEELQAVFDEIDEISGGYKQGFAHPVNFHDVLGGASINVLWHILAGKRYDHRDAKFKELIRAVQKLLQVSFQTSYLFNAVPRLAKIFPRLTGYAAFNSYLEPIFEFLQNEIDEHKKTIDYDHPRDFMDIYLSEIEKQKDCLKDVFNESQLKQVYIELFVAGTDTTLNTMSFAFLYMILYPEAQKKVQQELDEVIGKDRLPSLEDRARLPYVEATIYEVFRLSCTAPASLPRTPVTNEDYITFRGYHIPKGSIVVCNFCSLHHDPELWESPQEFIPERFLLKNGKGINREALLPFGAGKRACLGESLAKNNVFLFFTGLLQRYSLRVPDGQPKPSQEPDGRTVCFPKPYTVKVQMRN